MKHSGLAGTPFCFFEPRSGPRSGAWGSPHLGLAGLVGGTGEPVLESETKVDDGFGQKGGVALGRAPRAGFRDSDGALQSSLGGACSAPKERGPASWSPSQTSNRFKAVLSSPALSSH